MNNFMKKSTATLLTVGGLLVGGAVAGTLEFTATESGKKLIKGMEQGKAKELGEKTSENITHFNKRLTDDLDGGPNDSVTVALNGIDYKISKDDYTTYKKLMIDVENKYKFSDDDEELIETYILSSFASPDGSANVVIKFSSDEAEKQRALSTVYATVQARQKEKEKAKYGYGAEEKTREDFATMEEYMEYRKKQREIEKKQTENIIADSKKINVDENQDEDWGDVENAFGEEDKKLEDKYKKLEDKDKKLDAKLAAAKKEVEKARSLSKNELLAELRKFVKTTGGNPATEFDWYGEWAKKNNITPEDLVATTN